MHDLIDKKISRGNIEGDGRRLQEKNIHKPETHINIYYKKLNPFLCGFVNNQIYQIPAQSQK